MKECCALKIVDVLNGVCVPYCDIFWLLFWLLFLQGLHVTFLFFIWRHWRSDLTHYRYRRLLLSFVPFKRLFALICEFSLKLKQLWIISVILRTRTLSEVVPIHLHTRLSFFIPCKLISFSSRLFDILDYSSAMSISIGASLIAVWEFRQWCAEDCRISSLVALRESRSRWALWVILHQNQRRAICYHFLRRVFFFFECMVVVWCRCFSACICMCSPKFLPMPVIQQNIFI